MESQIYGVHERLTWSRFVIFRIATIGLNHKFIFLTVFVGISEFCRVDDLDSHFAVVDYLAKFINGLDINRGYSKPVIPLQSN